jgi:hypothetical protein
MNYYAQGGQAHGLKTLAKQLPKYGRHGDTMVAHINPQEAAMLKAMGGSGTINPTTGLPEFGMFGIGGGGGILGTGINKGASDPLSKALSDNAISKGISSGVQGAGNLFDSGLVSLDKTVGKSIPGGWGTVAAIAGSAMGVPTPYMVGLGALNGSGVMRKGGKFNLQGAMMGGAMAYAASELGDYARAAGGGGAVEAIEGAANAPAAVPMPTNDFIGSFAGPNAPVDGDFISGFSGANPAIPATPPGIGSNIMSGNFGTAADQIGTRISDGFSNLGTNISDSASNLGTKASNFYDAATNADTYTNAIDKGMTNASDTASGIKNLITGSADPAAAAAVKAGTIMAPGQAAGILSYTGMSLMALEEQRNYLKQQQAAGAISDAEYAAELAKIEAQADVARKAVAANPLQVNPGTDGVSEGSTLYGRNSEGSTLYGRGSAEDTLYNKNSAGGTTLYAMGGSVDDEYGMDEARGLTQGNMQNGFMGGGIAGYAAGGTPRFLSGGGDGMSDSIKASINGSQEARLADGEFVVPADVVSHLGNGSSKAGAKQLYSMMDKVRTARTGSKSQGKQINPRKYLNA